MGARLGICIGVAIALLLPLRLLAGEISGTLSQGGQPLASVEVRLECPGRGSAQTHSDNFGRYRLEIAGATGRCKVSVGGKEADVYVSAAPTRYDFERVGDTLRRR